MIEPGAAADRSTSQARADGPSQSRRVYILVILMLAYTCAYLDRSVISVVLPQLKNEFHFGDTGLGFLLGLPFVAFYVLFGVPVAMLADRSNRRNLIAASTAVWSVMTALCGEARSFTQLALAGVGVGVGVGEAGLSPPAQSIISDLFPERQRATALAAYSFGVYLGILVGLAGGGYLAQTFGWRRPFFVVALPGLFVSALFLLSVREPARGLGGARIAAAPVDHSFFDVVRFLWRQPALRYS